MCSTKRRIVCTVLDADEPRTQAQIAEDHSLSRQTVSSSVRALEQRQLVRLDYAEGSRRDKVVVLTKEGQDFCVRYVKPAMEAERRAFASLGKADQQAFVRTARAYADAVDRELGKLREEWGNAGGGEA